jgi:hypothetical protein
MRTLSSKIALLLSVGVLALSACSSPGSLIKKVLPSNKPTNVLTGLAGSNGPILAVKIDDTPDAHPQVGLEHADVVYIEQVEGGLTRLAAIYSQYPDSIPSAIGPVRSARISDLDILAQYGKVGFGFSGAQSKFYPKITAANLFNLSADHEPPTIYSRDPARIAPTDLILDAKSLLQKAIESEGKTPDTVKAVGWKFGNLPTDATWLARNQVKATSEVDIKWPSSSYQVIWSSEKKKWLINYHHQPDLVADGSQLSVASFIVQKVSITDSEYHDKLGGVTPFSNTVGTGTGYLLRDGSSYPISWSRPSATDGTSFTFLDGSEAKLVPSQVWIALTDKEPVFIYPPASTSTK